MCYCLMSETLCLVIPYLEQMLDPDESFSRSKFSRAERDVHELYSDLSQTTECCACVAKGPSARRAQCRRPCLKSTLSRLMVVAVQSLAWCRALESIVLRFENVQCVDAEDQIRDGCQESPSTVGLGGSPFKQG